LKLTFVGATPQKYEFSTNTTDSDPGDGNLRFNNESFASVSQIFIADKNFFDFNISNWLDGLDAGTAGRLTIENLTVSGAFRIFDVTGAVTVGGGYRKVAVAAVQSFGTFSNTNTIKVSFVRSGGTPQPYQFSDSTSTNPPNGILRFNSTTFASITQIYADDLSFNGFNIGGWLDKIDDQPDVRVTVSRFNDPSITRVFKVNSVVNSSGYRTINVTPIYASASALSDGTPIVLISSKADPIRDRAGALVVQQSLEGFPSGSFVIQKCTFQDADNGLRLDEPTPSNNCADNTIVQSNFSDCSSGVKVNSIQVVNNTIINSDFNECDVGIDHEKGGDIRVFGASMNGFVGGVFLKVRGGGNNASSFVLYGVRLEIATGKPSLIETTGSFEANILIDGFSWIGNLYPVTYNAGTTFIKGASTRIDNTIYESLAASNTGNSPATSPDWWRWRGDWVRPVRLGQFSNCTVRGAIIKGPFASVTGGGAKASLRLDNCRLNYIASDVITVDSTGYWKQIDCTNVDALPIADDGNWPDYPSVVAQTWNNGATTFTAMKLDVTDTASASGSLLMDLQVNADSRMKVDKSGNLYGQSFQTLDQNLSSSNPGLIVTQTWYNSSVVFTAAVINALDGGSAAGSMLLDLQVSGVSKVNADTTGKLSVQSLDVGGGVFVVEENGNIAMSGGGAILDVNSGDVVGIANLSAANLTLGGSVTANRFLSSPSAASGAPTFRAMVTGDVPVSVRTVSVSRAIGSCTAEKAPYAFR